MTITTKPATAPLTLRAPDGTTVQLDGPAAALVMQLVRHRALIEAIEVGEVVLGFNERKVWAKVTRSLPPITWAPAVASGPCGASAQSENPPLIRGKTSVG
ncbi:MAG TPA: hypothetical protein VGW38_04105 [Chloroflexota bacterium]|nr:hypothetical protein [Chloroflexota bacterium]